MNTYNEDTKYIIPAGTILDYSRGTRYWEDSFYFKSSDVEQETTEEIVIPKGITIIAEGCFAGCVKLQKVRMPDSIRLIDEGAFANCRNLSINWSTTLEEIGPCAFENTSLYNYDLPESLKSISFKAFNKNLDLIKVPSSLIKCSTTAFGTYSKTTEVLLRNPSYKLLDNCLINLTNNTLLFINPRSQSVTLPKEAQYWHDIKFNGVKLIVPLDLIDEHFWNGLKYRCSPIYSRPLTVYSEYSEKAQRLYDDNCSKNDLFSKKIKYERIDNYDKYKIT